MEVSRIGQCLRWGDKKVKTAEWLGNKKVSFSVGKGAVKFKRGSSLKFICGSGVQSLAIKGGK